MIYDHDDAGRLLEDYWAEEWATVAEEFKEIEGLGANVVRIHLQLGKFTDAADRPNAADLARLGKMVRLAEDTGLHFDVTGLEPTTRINGPVVAGDKKDNEWLTGELGDKFCVQRVTTSSRAGPARSSPGSGSRS